MTSTPTDPNAAARLARRIAERTERAVALTMRDLARLSENDAATLRALEWRDRTRG